MDLGRMTIAFKNTDFSTSFSIFEGADFSIFRNSRVFKVWTHHYTWFFMEISKKNIRKAYLQANEGLWANYIFYKKSKILKIFFPDRSMDYGSRIMDQVSRIKYLGPWTLDLAWMTILDGIPTWDQDHPNLLSKIYHFI